MIYEEDDEWEEGEDEEWEEEEWQTSLKTQFLFFLLIIWPVASLFFVVS